MAPVIVAGFVMAGSSAMNILIEAAFDTASDMVLDGFDTVMDTVFPAVQGNKYYQQFMNSTKMGVASATQAKIMGHAMRSQSKIEDALESKRASLQSKYMAEKERIVARKFRTKGGDKECIKEANDEYRKGVKQLDDQAKRQTMLRQSASTEAKAFSSSTGELKNANDGTLKSLAPDSNLLLMNKIQSLLNGMGYFEEKKAAATP